MKHVILILLGAALIFAGCKKDECTTPQASEFTGTSTWVADIDPGTVSTTSDGKLLISDSQSEWYEQTTAEQTSGKSMWTTNWLLAEDWSTGNLWGTSKIYVGLASGGNTADAKGVWEVTWEGQLTGGVFDPEIGFLSEGIITVVANGKGVSGEVQGKLAQWTYTLDIQQGFVYQLTGSFL